MISWLTGSLFGIAKWVWIVGISALIGLIILLANIYFDKTIKNAEEKGAIQAENKGHEITLDQVRKANEASEKVRSPGDPTRYLICLRDSAPGYESNCERYKPE